MKQCKTALAKCGTVTLELALHHIPTVVHYELSSLNYLFAKYILKLNLPNYCIANILADQTIYPEFIGKNLSLDKIKEALEKIHFDPHFHQKTQEACEKLKQSLESGSPHKKAAQAIEGLMTC
jgi:lipid-A-disaccharide synthase